MSTKNKKIKTYDLETVFSEYMAYLSQANTERSSALSADVETLIEQLEADKLALQHIQENLTKATQLEKEIKKIKVLTIDEAVNLGASIAKTEETYEKRTSAYEKLLNTDTSLFTEEQMQKWNANIAKAEEAMHKASERLEKLRKKHETNVANEELLATKTQELDALIFVEGDETAEVPEDGTVKDYLTGLVAEATAIVKEKEQELKQMQAELKVVSSEPVATLESFKAFLEENGLSTIHAEELFRYRHNPEKFEHLAIEDFAMRKMHPTRDAIIKKVVVPTAITSVAVGATIGAIAGSGLVGGSEVLGFIPVSGTPGLTATATTLTGAFAGLVSTPIIIKGKNLTTRTYYKLKSQSAAKNVEDYNDGTDLANIRASKLIAKIQHTQHSILSSRGPKSLLLKVINRNRIHQIVDYTIDLYKIYHEIESDETIDIKLKAETLKPIYDMLVNVEEFITNDIAEEITHSMLTCTTKKEHTTHMIENVDIYARLKITLDRLARANATEHEIAQQMKSAKKATRNITQKKQEAYKLVTGVKPITGVLNFERKYGEYIQVEQAEEPLAVPPKKDGAPQRKPDFTPKPESKVTMEAISGDAKTLILFLESGEQIEIPCDKVDFNKKIDTAKEGKNKFSITYTDGTKQEIMKKAKVIPEVETARHVLGALLHDNEFVQELKTEGFKANTITALKDKLTEWIQDPTQKLPLSGKVKELYDFTIAQINAEAKNDMNLN